MSGLRRFIPTGNTERGATLVELLITMGLLAGFLVVLMSVFTASIDVQSQNGSYSAVASDGRFVLSRLAYDIRRASAVSAPIAAGDTGNTLALTIGGVPYTYSVVSGRLQVSINGVDDYLTTDQAVVSGLQFRRLGSSGPPSVQYQFTLTGIRDPHNPLSQVYSSTTEVRQ
jgi:Tfp pilus assembly protein PilW